VAVRFTWKWNPLLLLLNALIGHCIILQKAPIKEVLGDCDLASMATPWHLTHHTSFFFFWQFPLPVVIHVAPVQVAAPMHRRAVQRHGLVSVILFYAQFVAVGDLDTIRSFFSFRRRKITLLAFPGAEFVGCLWWRRRASSSTSQVVPLFDPTLVMLLPECFLP